MKKRLFAILLALMMILSMSVTVLGAPVGGVRPPYLPSRPTSICIDCDCYIDIPEMLQP